MSSPVWSIGITYDPSLDEGKKPLHCCPGCDIEKCCCLPFWRTKYSAQRYYFMVFHWILLIIGTCGTFGYYTELNTDHALAPYWLPIFITIDIVSPIYLIWYFFIEYKVAGDNCCMCC